MATQASDLQSLQAAMVEMQLAYNALLNANTFSSNLVSTATIAAIQTAITTAQAAVNAVVPVFYGNN